MKNNKKITQEEKPNISSISFTCDDTFIGKSCYYLDIKTKCSAATLGIHFLRS